MSLTTYPKLTDATSDRQLIRLWIAQKSKTTQQTYLMVVQQFLNFTDKELREVRQLIGAASPGRDRQIVKLLYCLGLRVSELVGLNWSDFKQTEEGVIVTVFGKGSKTRSLLLPQPLGVRSAADNQK